MRLFKFFMIIFLATIQNLAFAENVRDPLVIIRFNSDYVSYDRSLTKAVNSALGTKEDVFFDVVAVTAKPKAYSSLKKKSRQNGRDVVSAIRRVGVSPDRVRLTYQEDKKASYDEVHVFVR